jgi:hypothetical protein
MWAVAAGLAVGVALAWTRTAEPAPVPKPLPLTTEQARKKLFGCWYEVEKVVAGQPWPKHNFGALGWKFDAEEVENWQLTGELVTDLHRGGPKINITTTPWRLDVHNRKDNGEVVVLAGIFKFEGDDLIWVTEFPGDGWYPLNPAADYSGRPTDFTSTKENRYEWMRLKRCEYLQTQFPEKGKK